MFAALAAILAWTSIRLNRKAELRTQRFAVYKEALDELDRLNQRLSTVFSELLVTDFQALLRNMLTAPPEKLTEHILGMNNILNTRIAQMNEIINVMYSRLNTVRLVASEESIEILDEMRDNAARILAAQHDLMSSISLPRSPAEIGDSSRPVFSKPAMENLAKLQEIYAESRKRLEKQMRQDVGFVI